MDARTPFTDSVAFQSCSYSMRQLAAMDDYAYAISNGYGYGNSVSGRGMMICGADWIGAVDQTGGLPAVDSRLEYAGFGQAPSPSVEQQAAAIIRGVAASHGRQPAAVRTGGKTTVPRGSNIGPDFRGNTALNVDISRLPLEGEPKKVDTRGAEVNARAALPWQIRRQLGEGCIGQAFTVSPVDPWDPDSAAILWEHYSQYGPVARVLVAHSDDNLANVSWSDTGAGMAAVVMVNQSDVDSIMAVGSIQHLHGKCVFALPSPGRVDMDAAWSAGAGSPEFGTLDHVFGRFCTRVTPAAVVGAGQRHNVIAPLSPSDRKEPPNSNREGGSTRRSAGDEPDPENQGSEDEEEGEEDDVPEPRLQVVSVDDVRKDLKQHRIHVDRALKALQNHHKEAIERQEALVQKIIENMEKSDSPRSADSHRNRMGSPRSRATVSPRGGKDRRIRRSRTSSDGEEDDGKKAGGDEDMEETPGACECGQIFAADATFCRGCGKKRPQAHHFVCQCGNVFKKDAMFCRKCGRRRPQEGEETPSEAPTPNPNSDVEKNQKRRQRDDMSKRQRKARMMERWTGMAATGLQTQEKFEDEVRANDGSEVGMALRIVRSTAFKVFTTGLIVTNCGFMTVQIQQEAADVHDEDPPTPIVVLDVLFFFLFTFELLCRVFAERWEFVWSSERWWNLFDTTLVAHMFQDNIATIVLLATGGETEEGGSDFSFIRTIRLLRVLRVVRVFKFCPQLTTIVNEILESISAVMWLFVLLGLIIFILSLLFMTVSTEFRRRDDVELWKQENMQNWFGSLQSSWFSLFQSMSGGMLWEDMGNQLMEISFIYGVVFVLYIGFSIFGIVNVVTGVFIESAQTTTRKEKMSYAEEMGKAIEATDSDNDGLISRDEFRELLGQGTLNKFMEELELDAAEAARLFETLETAGEGVVHVKHLSRQIQRLVGEAWRSNIITMHLENKMQQRKFDQFCRFTEERFRFLARALGVKSGPKFYMAMPPPIMFDF